MGNDDIRTLVMGHFPFEFWCSGDCDSKIKTDFCFWIYGFDSKCRMLIHNIWPTGSRGNSPSTFFHNNWHTTVRRIPSIYVSQGTYNVQRQPVWIRLFEYCCLSKKLACRQQDLTMFAFREVTNKTELRVYHSRQRSLVVFVWWAGKTQDRMNRRQRRTSLH